MGGVGAKPLCQICTEIEVDIKYITASKYYNVCEHVEVIDRSRNMVPTLPLLSCESSVVVKKDPCR